MGDDISINPYSPGPKRQVRRVTQLFVNPNYSIRPHRYDLAIVKVWLIKKIFRRKVPPIKNCLTAFSGKTAIRQYGYIYNHCASIYAGTTQWNMSSW